MVYLNFSNLTLQFYEQVTTNNMVQGFGWNFEIRNSNPGLAPAKEIVINFQLWCRSD